MQKHRTGKNNDKEIAPIFTKCLKEFRESGVSVGLSKKDRDSLFKIFRDVIDTLWPSFEPIIDRLIATGLPRPVGVALTESEEEAYRRIMSDLTILNMYKSGNQMYAYGETNPIKRSHLCGLFA